MEGIVDIINQVGFPIFACVYLGGVNQKILTTLDRRLELIDLRLENLEKEAHYVKSKKLAE